MMRAHSAGSTPAALQRDVQEGGRAAEHCTEATQEASRAELAPNQSHVLQDIALCDHPTHGKSLESNARATRLHSRVARLGRAPGSAAARLDIEQGYLDGHDAAVAAPEPEIAPLQLGKKGAGRLLRHRAVG